MLNEILSDRGYKVRALPNGMMGLSACNASPPDLVLLDINMPGMDGYEVAKKLKANAVTKDIPIIFISAMSQTDDKVKAFQAGGVDYVTKPLQVEEVMARVETHLSINRMREQINQANEKLLSWAVELSQPGAASKGVTQNFVPESLAEQFGRPSGELKEGDKTDCSLSIIGACSPSEATLNKMEDEITGIYQGGIVARFGNLLIGVSSVESEQIAQGLKSNFDSEDLDVCLGFGEGVLLVRSPESETSLDFKSPALLEALAGLNELGSAET